MNYFPFTLKKNHPGLIPQTLIGLLGIVGMFSSPSCSPAGPDPEQTFSRFAEHFDSGFGPRKAEDPCHDILKGVSLYNAKSYAEAVPELKQLLPQITDIRKCGITEFDIQRLLGISQVMSGDAEGALESLAPQLERSHTARWYYILALVRLGKMGEAAKELGKWEAPMGFYQVQKGELLKIISR